MDDEDEEVDGEGVSERYHADDEDEEGVALDLLVDIGAPACEDESCSTAS